VPRRKPPLDATADVLNSAAIHLLRGLREVDRRSGLTPARLSALSVLVFGGPCTQTALAAAEGVTAATTSRVVDGLVELGLADRSPHPDSGRAVLVSATPEGERVMLDARRARVQAISAALAALPASDRAAVVAAAPALRALATEVPRHGRARRETTRDGGVGGAG
jgi:DNA-binding MarR family transcriptional regulator